MATRTIERVDIEWISVKDMVPPKAKICLVYDSHYETIYEAFIINGVWYSELDDFHVGNITHWTPSPKYPKL